MGPQRALEGDATGAAKARDRLSAEDWVRAALDALVEEGASGLRVARLARRLGVTSGSFYWHFRDRRQLEDRLLRRWLEMLEEAASAADRSGEEGAKMRALPRILGERRLPELDAAMRAWAQEDAAVAAQVRRADGVRIRRVEALLRAAGLDEATAARRAPLLLWAHVGSIGADPKRRAAALGELVKILLAPPGLGA